MNAPAIFRNIHACPTASLISWVSGIEVAFESWCGGHVPIQGCAFTLRNVVYIVSILLACTFTPKMTDQHQQPLSLLNNIVSPDSPPGTSSTLTHGSCKTLKIGMACAQGTCLSSGWHSHGVLSCMAQERVAFMQRQSTFSQTISFGKYLPPVYPTLMLMGTPLNV